MPDFSSQAAYTSPAQDVCSGQTETEQMPKMKTNSGAKKRFKLTASGKVKVAQAGKQHGMIKRTNKFIRQARGTMVMAEPDARVVRKHFLPNG
jgi:large subunit ribosomal protein L35